MKMFFIMKEENYMVVKVDLVLLAKSLMEGSLKADWENNHGTSLIIKRHGMQVEIFKNKWRCRNAQFSIFKPQEIS